MKTDSNGMENGVYVCFAKFAAKEYLNFQVVNHILLILLHTLIFPGKLSAN